jgi:head-tail adaptor
MTVNSRILWQDGATLRTFNVRSCWDRDQRQRRLEVEATEVTE